MKKKAGLTAAAGLMTTMILVAPVSAETTEIKGSSIWEQPGIQKTAAEQTYRAAAAALTETDNLSELKSIIHAEMNKYNTSFSIDYTGATANLKAELDNILKQIYAEDEYLYGTVSKTNYGYTGFVNDVTITFNIEYLTTNQQEAYVDTEIESILSKIIKDGMSEFEKVKAVNDFIVQNTSYSFDTEASPHSVYALLTEQKGVCQGYALLAYRLLNALEFDVQYVTGVAYANGEGIDHAWNLVKVDGKWYYLDTTWNDPTPNRPSQVQYNYFLVTADQLAKDHEWEQAGLPAATSTDFSFMHEMTEAYTANGEVYYNNKNDNNKLYKMNVESRAKKKLSDSRAYFITALKDTVYFSNFSNGARLTKIQADGSGQTELNKEYSMNLYINGQYLYYSLQDGIQKNIKISDELIVDEAKYSLWAQKETILANKEWKIQFNMPLNGKFVNNENVYVVNKNGEKVSFIQAVIENGNYIRLKNSGTFTKGEKYYVVIEKDTAALSGKTLKKGIYMPFLVK